MTKPVDQPEDATAFPMTIEEWATRRSSAPGVSVEMLNAFAATQFAAGLVKALETEFEERFGAFANEPA